MAAMVEMSGICKRFGGTVALDRVDFCADRGQVHALLGENGAGKSTLMRILVGAIRRDAGTISLDGREIDCRSTADARTLGIAAIFQELTILPELSVAKNIFLSREKTAFKCGLLAHRRMNDAAQRLLAEIGVSVDVRRRAGDFSIAQQQMIEIARAFSCGARVLIMDEPTSCLTPAEVSVLFDVIRRVAAGGTAVIYISHRLGEILQIADRATILRDGRVVERMPITPATDRAAIVRAMIGRSWKDEFPPRHARVCEPVVEVKGFSRRGAFNDVELTVRGGEVVGIFGLLGAGRTELARALFGADSPDGGTVAINGQAYAPRDCRWAIRRGIGLVPEDRKEQGVLLQMSIQHNVTLTVLDRLQRLGLLPASRIRATAAELVRRLGIKIPSLRAEALALSGGNQQKLVLAKWLARGAKLFILDEPTRGVDVEAKLEIYRLINRLAEEGCGILLISSEAEEVIGMSDRILVMSHGRIRAELPRDCASEELLMLHATGASTKET